MVQGLVVKYATVLWKDPFATLSGKRHKISSHRGGVRKGRLVKVPDVVTTPECFLLTGPGSLHRHELWENQVKEMDQPRKGDSL